MAELTEDLIVVIMSYYPNKSLRKYTYAENSKMLFEAVNMSIKNRNASLLQRNYCLEFIYCMFVE